MEENIKIKPEDIQCKVYGDDKKQCKGFIYYLDVDEPEVEPLIVIFSRNSLNPRSWAVTCSLTGGTVAGNINIDFNFELPQSNPALTLVCEAGIGYLHYGLQDLIQCFSLYDFALGGLLK